MKEDLDSHGAVPPREVVRFDGSQSRLRDRRLVEQQGMVPNETSEQHAKQK